MKLDEAMNYSKNQIATLCGISTQMLDKLLKANDEELKSKCIKGENKRLVIPQEVAEIIASRYGKDLEGIEEEVSCCGDSFKTKPKPTLKPNETKTTENNDISELVSVLRNQLEILCKQLEIKDKQIEEQHKTIEKLVSTNLSLAGTNAIQTVADKKEILLSDGSEEWQKMTKWQKIKKIMKE